MGVMVQGRYQARDPGPGTNARGEYERAAATIRNRIGDKDHPPDPGRYHLYAAWNCPWAHRALLARALLGLEDAIGVSYARPRRTEEGWVFDAEGPHADPCLGVLALHQVYARHDPPYTGRVTVPVLWDRRRQHIVSNESADILRMFAAFGRGPDLRPAALAAEIDRWNERIHADVNNGVYKAGFATTQAAYDTAVHAVFAALDDIEDRLAQAPWLAGETFTEADLRLFPTLARFDVAYHYAFRCNIRRLCDYTHLWRYARRIHAMPKVAATVRFDIYKQGYFSPSPNRNLLGIVPAGPRIDWSL